MNVELRGALGLAPGLGSIPGVHGTSAAGSMRVDPGRVKPVLVLGMLAGLSTSADGSLPLEPMLRLRRAVEQTTAGVAALVEPAGPAIGELRRLSGFTWEQLARLFGVSRRSLHLWASGKPMASSNEERLQRLLSVVRQIDRGSASENRALLLGSDADGQWRFDLLASGHYDRVVSELGPGRVRRAIPPRLSAEARAARAPRAPEELVGALQDRIHPASGRLLGAKPIVTKRRT